MPIALRAVWLLLVVCLALASPPTVTSTGELWAQAATLQTATRQAACPSEPVGGFGRVWSNEPGLRDRLGCPSGPEAQVDIRLRRDADVLGIWLEDHSEVWFEIASQDQTYQPRSKQSDAAFWQARPSGVMLGSAQPFAGGTMVSLPGDGTRMILVLDDQGKAQELSD